MPVHGQARDGGQAGGDRGVPGDDAAAVEPLAEDDVVDLTRVEALLGRSHHVIGQVEGGGIAERAPARGADRGAQGGYQDSLGHGWPLTRRSVLRM